jgi:hypothetical protein
MGVAAGGAGRALRVALLVLAVLLATAASARADGVVSYMDQSYAPLTGAPTGSKPESKLWYAHGSWWGILMDGATQTEHIFRLDRTSENWVDTGVSVDDRPTARADTLWDKAHDKLYVASHEFVASGTASATSHGALWRFSYDKSAKSYRLDAGFPVPINSATSETLVIDMDSLGRLWATWTQDKQVYVSHATDATNTTWIAPYVLPTPDPQWTTVMADDISSLVAFGDGQIGVMWSNQRYGNDYFAVHADTAPDDATGWIVSQVPVDPLFPAYTFADDHFNLKADGDGNVYAAVKHSTDNWLDPGTPFTSLLVRDAAGSWSRYTISTTTERHTRAIVELDTEHKVIHVFDTGPVPGARSGDGGGTIYEKSSPMDGINFPPGHGDPVIGGSGMGLLMNDATSTKQNVSSKTGLVVAASDTKGARYWHADQTLGGAFTLPPARTASGAPDRQGPSADPQPQPEPPSPPSPSPSGPSPHTAVRQLVLTPIADGDTSARRPAARDGRGRSLRVRAGRHGYRTYLKFRVTGVTGTLTAAHLRLRTLAPAGAVVRLLRASNRWNESGLSWRSAPGLLPSPRLTLPRAARAGVVDVDVHKIVNGAGVYTFVLTGSRGAVAFSSREGRAPAKLVLTLS